MGINVLILASFYMPSSSIILQGTGLPAQAMNWSILDFVVGKAINTLQDGRLVENVETGGQTIGP